MHPHVQKLIELQKVDQEIASLRRDLDSLPSEETRRRRKLDEAERTMKERKEKADKAEVAMRGMEKGIKGGDDEVKKLNERLNVVRNNAEYQATLLQIESVKKERDQMQEDCLKLIEQQEGLRAEVAAAAAVLAEEQKVFAEFERKAAALRAERQVEVDKVQQRRNAMAEGLPHDLLGEYTRMFEARGGVAVCPVENQYCQGCYNKITANDVARLKGKASIVMCGSCQRILYLH